MRGRAAKKKKAKLNSKRRRELRSMLFCERPWVECHYCGTRLQETDSTVDHIRPRSTGGTNHISNLVLCCWFCNQRKADLDYRTFVRWCA